MHESRWLGLGDTCVLSDGNQLLQSSSYVSTPSVGKENILFSNCRE